jgi:hypothetical protein
VLLTLAACGGGGDNAPPPDGPAPAGTLAYVDTACRDGADGFSATQELRVRRGESAAVTAARVPIGPLPASSACAVFGSGRDGLNSLAIGVFQRLGVSPDGTAIVFEVTDDFSGLGQNFVPPEREGIFFIRADGSGLRRLGDASRFPASGRNVIEPAFQFSPNGKLVVFTDMGPSPGGEDAAQVFILDVETGSRRQVTHLPPAPVAGGIYVGTFLNDRTILFGTFSTHAEVLGFTVTIDDGELQALSLVALPGSGLIPFPVITGFGRLVFLPPVPGLAVNPRAGSFIKEVFITDGTNVLQLTNFRRSDTSSYVNPVLSVDGERVFLSASVNPPGDTNPFEICQIFSVDALGGDLRQLTQFGASRHSALGCVAGPPSEGCRTDFNFDQKASQDTRTGTLVFVSSCDPFGTNPNGEQIFAMRPDGSGLHALTDAHSVRRNPDGSVEAELPGPWSYGPHR